MAVSSMKKIEIFIHSSLTEKMINELQNLGVVQIIQVTPPPPASETLSLKEELKETEEVLQILDQFIEKKSLFKTWLVLNQENFYEVGKKYDLSSLKQKVNSLLKKLSSLEKEEALLKANYQSLLPWQGLTYPLEKLKDTAYTKVLLGKISRSNWEKLKRELPAESLVEIISIREEEAYILLIIMKQDFATCFPQLKEQGFTEVTLPGEKGIVAQRIATIENQLLEIKAEKEEAVRQIKTYLKEQINLMIKVDYLREIIAQQEVKNYLARTKHTSIISGWIKKKDVERLKSALAHFKEKEIIISSPEPEDTPPVDFENKPLFKPFEVVTKLYDVPRYVELDPTPYLAPFFALFFGLCLTDAGYGVVLLLLSIFLLKKFTGQESRQLMRLLIISSILTVAVGLLTGGIFGIQFQELPPSLKFLQKIRDSLMLFDPIKDAMTFFILALSLGVIHILVGFFLRFFQKVRNGEIFGAVVDELAWMLIVISLISLLLFTILAPGFVIGKNLSLIIFVLACLAIVFFAGRPRKGAKRILMGLYKLYGITGLLGDLLSYTRLFALGLVTCILAWVINILAGFFWGFGVGGLKKGLIGLVFFFPIGAVVSLFIIIGGHFFIILINALGAFVHTVRLQFVEFFTKFYEGGGEMFSPFRKERKYVMVKESKR